jgi:serine protease Do
VTPDMQTQLGLATDSGALIDEVTTGQPADAAGLQRGDVIVSLGGKPVTSSAQLRSLIVEKKPGDQVPVEYYRGNDKRSATVTLGQRPSNP